MSILNSIIFSLILGLVGYIKKAFTKPALLLATVLTFFICYCGNLTTYIILLETFVFTILADNFMKKKKHLQNKDKKRNYKQIICNVMIGTLALIFYKLTSSYVFFISYAAVMAESLADSMASGIGILSNRCINLITWEKQYKGISGGISLLGIFASFIGSFIIGLTFCLSIKSVKLFNIIFLCGVLGALFDSILGNFQIKYKCIKCQKVTDNEKHCNTKAKYHKGFKWLDNNVVNLLSNIFSFYLSIILFGLL